MRVVDVTPTYSELDGTPKDVPNDIHHHRETLVGPGDPWLLARVGAAWGKVLTSARLGATLPLGSTVPDPYELGREGKWHEHIQFGSGTVVPVAAGGIAWRGGLLDLSADALGFFAVGRATMHVASVWLPYVAVDFVHEGLDVWHGLYGDESYLRNDVLAACGLGWTFARGWTADVGLAFRVAQFGSGASFDYPGILQIAIATHLDGLR